MAFTLTEQLQRLGVEESLAAEIARQLSAGPAIINKLLAVGMPVGLAEQLVNGITDEVINVDKLTAMGMNPVVARYLGKQINLPPANTTAPVLSGTPNVGEVLSVTNGTWTSPSGDPTYTRKWFRGTTQLAETGATYTLVVDDVGFNITVQVEATNVNGSSVATSNAIGPVVAA